MDTLKLTREHRALVSRAAALNGVASGLKTPEDADNAVSLIDGLGQLLTAHLTVEDREVYSVLMNDPDPALCALAETAFEDVGSLVGAWRQFQGHWTRAAMLDSPRRFAAATSNMLTALMMRVQLEENTLYPAAAAALDARRAGMAAA